LRGQRVVVPELELLHGDGVVLVHHRYDAHLEERAEGVARAHVLLAVAQVLQSQQHLRALDPDGVEDVLVVAHQVHLAHRGERLLLRDLLGLLDQAHAEHARADRARGHENHADALLVQPRDGLAQRADLREVQRARLLAEQAARADLDHHGGLERVGGSGGVRKRRGKTENRSAVREIARSGATTWIADGTYLFHHPRELAQEGHVGSLELARPSEGARRRARRRLGGEGSAGDKTLFAIRRGSLHAF
jgi:hypothetical protein